MGSQIVHIFNRIADIGIMLNGSPIIGRDLLNVSTVVNETPTRIISPLTDKNEGKKATRFTLGASKQVDWTITDLLLFRDTSDGTGLEDDMRWLVEYMGTYVETMSNNYELSFPKHVKITSVDVEIGVYRYPIAGEKFYHGAKATLIVHEIIP